MILENFSSNYFGVSEIRLWYTSISTSRMTSKVKEVDVSRIVNAENVLNSFSCFRICFHIADITCNL